MRTIADLTKNDIIKLRGEMKDLRSNFMGDYKNTMGIDEEDAFLFFQDFIGWVFNKWREYHPNGFVRMADIDTIANLNDYLKELRG